MKRDNSMTGRHLAEAGVAPGMRVMEIGCGNGEVTQLLAEMVGASGSIVAVDHSEKAMASARERMRAHGIDNVRFVSADVAGDLSCLEAFERESFDALVGRRILMYLKDPSAVVGRLVVWLRSGGLVAFEESDSTMVPARTSPMPAHDQAVDWLRGMLVSEGANPAMGFAMPDTFVRAGLRLGRIRAEAVIQGQGTQFPLSELMEMLQARIVSASIATQEEMRTLCDRLVAESRDPACVYVSDMSFCAWAYKP